MNFFAAAETMDKLPTGKSAWLLSMLWRFEKAKVDVERLRAKLQQSYRQTFRAEARQAIAEAINALQEMSGVVDESDVSLVLESLEARLGADALGTTLTARSTAIVRDVFSLAAGQVKAGYKLTVTDQRAIKIISDQNLFWIRDHFDDDLLVQFRETTTEVMRTGLSRRKLAEALADRLGDVVDADAGYWSDLADHTITKSRLMGQIAAFEEAGIKSARVKAVMDGKTSQICRDLNGRIIPVSHLSRQRDNIMAATSVAELKKAHPWTSRYTGSTADLPENIGSPPYHGRCRTQLFGLTQPIRVKTSWGDRVASDDRAMLERFTPQEHTLRAQDIQTRAKHHGLTWHEPDLRHDIVKARFLKHARGEFGDTDEEYYRRSNDTVLHADEVMAHVYRPKKKGMVPRIQYSYYSRRTNAFTVVDDNGAIRGCFQSEDIGQTVAGISRERLWLRNND